ncbi:MAG: nicotinate-nucleotide--dimethylbenzimidazole phosphoribosyltransferase [Candidatus Omnitrophota bacterium]
MSKLADTIEKIKRVDYSISDKAQKKLDSLTKPQGSLGRLEDLAKQVVNITGNLSPTIENKVIFTLAGDHGITDEGVSAFPKEVTPQMVYNFLKGGAGINVLAKHVGARVVVADLGVACDLKGDPGLLIAKVNYGTKNMAKGPAMSRNEAIKSIENGIEIFESALKEGIDIAGTGDMGIGNTTASSAITSVITKASVEDVTGRGTGIGNKSLSKKVSLIKEAIQINAPDPCDALDVLSKVGGFEIGGIAGIILSAASRRIPVVLDGFISAAGALLAYQLAPETREYMIAAHTSVEKGHRIALDFMKLEPLLALNLRLGEGTGAALGISIVEASVKILTQMATFESASVSQRTNEKTPIST